MIDVIMNIFCYGEKNNDYFYCLKEQVRAFFVTCLALRQLSLDVMVRFLFLNYHSY